MAAAATDSSWIPQVEGGKAKVAVGSSLRKYLRQRRGIQERPSKSRVPDHDYFAFKYRFKPHNVDSSKPGVLERPGGEGMWSLTRPNTKGENVTWAGGEVQAKKGELMCVLIYDESVGSFTLERLDTHMTLQHLPAASNGPPIVAPVQRAGQSSQIDGDRALDAELAAQLLGDDEDADGSDEMEAVPVPTTSKPRRSQPAPPAAPNGFAELLQSARAPAQPGLGKGVALAQAEAARQKAAKAAKAAKVKAGSGGPRGKKRSSDELAEVEPPAPAPAPAPVRPAAARPPKRRKSPPPPPPPPPPALSLPTPRDLLVAPVSQPPIFSDDDEDGMVEVDPDAGEDVMIEVDPDAEQHDQNAEFDAFERELMFDGDGHEGGDDADIFGEGYGDDELSRELDIALLDDEGDDGDDGDMEQVEYVDDGGYANGYTNGHTNGGHVQHAYDDSSTDSESDDD